MTKIDKMQVALLKNNISELRYYNSFGKWTLIRLLRLMLEKEEAVVSSSAFCRTPFSWEKDQVPNFMTESTFEECIDIDVLLESNELKIEFWDGESLYGRKVEVRCWWKIKVDFNQIEPVRILITQNFASLCEDLREKEEREAKEKRRKEIGEELLKGEE